MIVRLHLIALVLVAELLHFSSAGAVRTTDDDANDEGGGIVGVTYKASTPDIPDPNEVARQLFRMQVPRVLLIDPDMRAVAAFINTNIDLSLSLENVTLLQAIASNASAAVHYLTENVVPVLSTTGVKISSISVGYGILTRMPSNSRLLLQVIINFRNALRFLKITNISVTTVHSFDTIVNPVPPSSAEFNSSIAATMKTLLDFTSAIGAPFLISLFPYNLYRRTAIPGVTISFIKFEAREDQFYLDPVTHAKYPNLYDMMADAVLVALAKMGHSTMPIVVTRTGWPTEGEKDAAPEATFLNAAEYNERLVIILNMKHGTPLRRKVTPVTYIHGLFDEKIPSDGEIASERSWGICNADLSSRYAIKFKPDHNDNEMQVGGVKQVFCFCAAILTCLALVVTRGR